MTNHTPCSASSPTAKRTRNGKTDGKLRMTRSMSSKERLKDDWRKSASVPGPFGETLPFCRNRLQPEGKTMLKAIRDAEIAQIRQRVSEGDCPITPPAPRELMEEIILELDAELEAALAALANARGQA